MDATSSSLQASSSSTPNFQPVFERALDEYKKKTGKDLTTHPLAAEIKTCASPQAILTVLEGKANELNQSQNSDDRLTKWLNPTVNILNALSATLGQGAGLVFPPTTIIFSGLGILLVAAKNTLASRDMLVELFERIESFFTRIKTYTEVPPTPELADALAKTMAEVLSILAIATMGMKKKRWKIFVKQLAGMNEIEDALQRLGKLEQGELLTVIAQVSTDARGVRDDTKEIKADVKEIKNQMHTREHGNFLRNLQGWLSPPEPSTNYELGLHTYHKGTATWFMDGDSFQQWDSTGSLLWIHGKPGSGKSILCSAIIQRVLSLYSGGRAFVAYFYFDFRDEKKKRRHNLLASLLVQFAAQSISFCDILSPVYSAHLDGKQLPGEEVLMQCLKEMLSASPERPIYIIMDAVDECPDSSGVRSPRAQVLSFIQELVDLRLANLRICITSRPEIDIRNRLEPLTSISVSLHDETGHQEDIANYIRSEVYFIAHDKRWREDDKVLVIETLSEKADGMFRWVFCQLEMLRLCVRSTVRQFVNELPDTLDETYERVLTGIPKTNRGYVRHLLQCVAVAIRPLRVDELAQILTFRSDAIQEEVSMLDSDSQSEDQEQEILSACPSLITIGNDYGSRVVQFSHFSVKEFLMSGRLSTSSDDISHYHIIPDDAHTTIAQASLGILLQLDDRVDRWRDRNIWYAAEHWVSHVQVANTSPRVTRMMETLFDLDKPHFSAWVQIHDIDGRHWINQGTLLDPDSAKPLYYAARCGLYNLVEHLIEKYPGHVNALGGQYDYPLVAALRGGHSQVANILLQRSANVGARGNDGKTPLHHALGWFNDTMFGTVQFLLENGADANVQKGDLRTPLHLAAAWGNEKVRFDSAPISGHTNVVQLLLEHSANVNAEDSQGQTPLHQVLEGAYDTEEGSSVIQLLMEHGADVNKRDKDHVTPLHLASRYQHLKLAQVLLDHGANVNAEDNRGQTPLHQVLLAFLNEQGSSVLQLLIEHGADINKRDKDHATPLHLASRSQHLKLAQVLLDHGASVNAKDNRSQTPLHRVLEGTFFSEEGFSIVQLLVERGADVNTRDEDHKTPLHAASYCQHPESVRVLLDNGANVNAKDSQGRTALYQVFEDSTIARDSFDVVQLLVDRGANVNTRDKENLTPLHLASYRRKLESVRVLLDHGANVNTEDSQGRSPLHQVFENLGQKKRRRRAFEDSSIIDDSFDLVQLLAERGADVNMRDKHSNTPLHTASNRQNLESVRVLLDHGANVNAEDSQGWTPLHQVFANIFPSLGDGFNIVKLLAKRGADVNKRVKDQITPLHLASYRQWLESARVLLDHGANVNAEDSQGRTPFYRVFEDTFIFEGSFGFIRLLVERGADVNTRNKQHETPLHRAAYCQWLEGVQALLDYGANVNAEDSYGRTPLHKVFEVSSMSKKVFHLQVIHLLVERGADVNKPDKDHITPLHLASFLQGLDSESIGALLDLGANVNAEDNWGQTPLHLVFGGPPNYHPGDCAILQLLVKFGADVNARDAVDETPLHRASRRGSFEGAWVLLKHGADLKVKNKEGKIPFQLAREIISEDMTRAPPDKIELVERVVLMSLLYEY